MSYLDRPYNAYQDVADEARADWLDEREPDWDAPTYRRPAKPWDGNPETAPDGPDDEIEPTNRERHSNE